MMEESHSRWVFSWRRQFYNRWHLLLAVMIVSAAAVAFFLSVRVQVFSGNLTPPKQADLLLLTNDVSSRDLLARLAQKTPFPMIHGRAEIEALAAPELATAGRMEILPPSKLKAVIIPRAGKAFSTPYVLPKLEQELMQPQKVASRSKPQPRVKLASASVDPLSWPLFYSAAGRQHEARFMIHIAENGYVDQYQAMDTEKDSQVPGIGSWLLSLRYPRGHGQVQGWVVCEIEWVNVAP